MYVIVGLGNPDAKYRGTRHNAGFRSLDILAERNHIDVSVRKHRALMGKGIIQGQKVILAKPQTYMNLSGESVLELAEYYKIDLEELIVLYDDISLDPGQLRIREKGSAGGHNGIKNIIAELGTNVFPRIKIGVGEKPPRMDLVDYVLGRFSEEEKPLMEEAFGRAAEAVEMIIGEGIAAAMNHYNQKKAAPASGIQANTTCLQERNRE